MNTQATAIASQVPRMINGWHPSWNKFLTVKEERIIQIKKIKRLIIAFKCLGFHECCFFNSNVRINYFRFRTRKKIDVATADNNWFLFELVIVLIVAAVIILVISNL